MKKFLICSLLGLSISGTANATYSNYVTDWYSDGSSSAYWYVDANNVLNQTNNAGQSVAYQSNGSAINKSFSGSIGVNRTSDNDFIGFVLGYQDGELNSHSKNRDLWVIDWKGGNQWGMGSEGLALSHVTKKGFDEVQRGATLANTGWEPKTSYDYDLNFGSDLIELFIDGKLELSLTAAAAGLTAFADGAFGFYNYSQANAFYSLDKSAALSEVPLPAAAWLFAPVLAGIFGLKKRSNRKNALKTA